MSNFDTVKSITDNLQTVLKQQGINFEREITEDITSVGEGKLPLGQLKYEGEIFEYTHGQKPFYVDIRFLLRVILKNRDAKLSITQEQEWVHKIRDALIVDALNIDDLASSKLVSKVDTEGVEIDHPGSGVSDLNYGLLVRYREEKTTP